MITNVYFIEYLNIPLWLFFSWHRIVTKSPQIQLYVFDTSLLMDRFFMNFSSKLGLPIKKLSFRLAEMKTQEGISIRLKAPYQDLIAVVDDIQESEEFINFEKSIKTPSFFKTLIAKKMAFQAFNSQARYSQIGHALLLVLLTAWHREHVFTNSQPILFLRRRPWIRSIKYYASKYNIVVRTSGFRRKLGGLNKQLRVLLGAFAKKIIQTARDIPFNLKEKTLRDSEIRLAIECYGYFNLDQPQCYSDLFFWKTSSLKGKDLLMIFSLSKDPINKERWGLLRKENIKAVARTVLATNLSSDLVPVLELGSFRPRAFTFLGGRNDDIHYLKTQWDEFEEERVYWTRLFEQNQVRLYTHWFRYDASHIAIAQAIKDLGGVMTLYQRAYESHPNPETAVVADVFFGFSAETARIESKNRSQISNYVITGYLGDHRFSLLKPIANDIRKRLHEAGARFVVSFFDENTVDDERWFIGNHVAQENYEFLLTKLLSDSQLGLVFKPKSPATLLRRLGPVAALMEKARQTGRVYIFDQGVILGTYPPAAAALASDLAIHESLSAGTAGLEAALAGVPTVLLDQEGWPFGPLSQLKQNKSLFKSWDSLWRALEDYRNHRDYAQGVGDWSEIINDLDPFRDGRAAERMGDYLKWMLESLREGKSRDEAMAQAAERYMKAWGQDKIIRM